MERKAIQIVAYPDHLYALCDDGAIFQLSQGAWFELEPIPHTEKTGLTEVEITERIKELAAKHGVDATKLLGEKVRASAESIGPAPLPVSGLAPNSLDA